MVDGRFQCLINPHTGCFRFPRRIIHLPHLSSSTHLGSITPKSQTRDITVFGKPNKCRWRSSESAGQILSGSSSNAGYSKPATNATWPTRAVAFFLVRRPSLSQMRSSSSLFFR
ncbi:uncharacterized protein VDAG_03953 [Verticillium dahliae VdLs.17]|uniref:Uncharacterized protein n=1 Tax=Verticillium dahliae (strain VdLs.17 / ATCC MYA-4575 / FGSC 10137) TaxID=498257 RepID=G2X124_VERDV|nr:uncharacterized protein VDAG_03953 [Verticillium dahliae VdLs.17]EGY22515.1 hypothetical protein VDAG_03953 [Verticillium dahliae VdLs.17]KAH6704940.1 hypothetical protein EV126DRAFT_199386 [Verticillium dahliae]